MPAPARTHSSPSVTRTLDVGFASLQSESTARPGLPSRTDVMDPNSVDAYTCETLAPGNVARISSNRSPGLASPPKVICSSGGRVTLRLRASARRKRQNVGVALTQVTPSVQQRVQAVLGLARERCDERRLARGHVQQHLDAGELLRAVREEPALLGHRPHARDRLAEDPPVVARRLRQAGGAGRADHERLFGVLARPQGVVGVLGHERLGAEHLEGAVEVVSMGHDELVVEH